MSALPAPRVDSGPSAGSDSAVAKPGLTLILAPAGYDKCAVLLRLCEETRAGVHRFRCAPDSASEFWPSLLTFAATALDPELDLSALLAAPTAHALAARITTPVTLAIEDYHLATSAANDLLLAELSALAPALHLIITARRVQLLDGPLVHARQRIRLITAHELAMREDAALALAAAAGLTADARLHAALTAARGWPAAVRAAIGVRSPAHLADAQDSRDPLANLTTFALHHLEILGHCEREILFAAAQLDGIDFEQAREVSGCEPDEVRSAVYHLRELGLLIEMHLAETTDFRCHPAVAAAYAARARRSSTAAHRAHLLTARAQRIADHRPATAVRLFCLAERYAEAETTLRRHFVRITGDPAADLSDIRALPDEVLMQYPGFTAARLLQEARSTEASAAQLQRLTRLWHAGLTQHTRDLSGPESWELPVLAELMVAERLLGNAERAARLAEVLEVRLTTAAPLRAAAAAHEVDGHIWFHRELAATALSSSDFPRARKHWVLVHDYARQQHSATQAFAHGTVSTNDPSASLLLASLHELALTEVMLGDYTAAAALMRDADALEAEGVRRSPDLSWVSGELARALLSSELGDAQMLERAVARLAPVREWVEQWPLLMLAETIALRTQRGIEWSLSHLRDRLAEIDGRKRLVGRWRDHLLGHHAALCVAVGDFQTARELLAQLPPDTPMVRLDQARLAVFSGDCVTALLTAQSVNASEATTRQQIDQALISAVALRELGRIEEACESFQGAAALIRRHGLPSRMWGVPYDSLHAVAVAAQESGICDFVAEVEGIPEPARSHRYERLTEMERRALAAIAEHGSTNDAAAALFVTPGTIKKHLTTVYRKLRVSGRDEAILRATLMGILARSDALAA